MTTQKTALAERREQISPRYILRYVLGIILFYAGFVFARGHARVLFEYVVEMRQRIETELVRYFRKRPLLPNQLFRLVRFQFQIRLVNAHSRLFTEKGTKMGLSVMQFHTQFVQRKIPVHPFREHTHDLVL